jgi:diadenosine tetraphosphate (Ap4A) HIT family hydrolase
LKKPFSLDPQIEAASRFVMLLPLSQLRLMNDTRFPWLLLVPQIPGAEEWTDLNRGQQQQLTIEIDAAAHLVRSFAEPDKINVASLGNIVRQLHIHVVGRKRDDPAWPGPVWGFGSAVPYAEPELDELCGRLQELMTEIMARHI